MKLGGFVGFFVAGIHGDRVNLAYNLSGPFKFFSFTTFRALIIDFLFLLFCEVFSGAYCFIFTISYNSLIFDAQSFPDCGG
jgi:hypothetical protein